jgi:hypothetical protein
MNVSLLPFHKVVSLSNDRATPAFSPLLRFHPRSAQALWDARRRDVSSYLLIGPAGVDHVAAAKVLAVSFVCPNAGCLACDACRAVLADVHPDVTMPPPGSSLEAVKDLRNLVARASLAPSEASFRVIIVSDLLAIGQFAPVLLKAVEEPAPRVKWILCASAITSELQALASRCYRVELEAPLPAEIVNRLESLGVANAGAVAHLLGRRLDRAEMVARLKDPLKYLSQWQGLWEVLRPDPRWLRELAFRLDPTPSLGKDSGRREVAAALMTGLEVFVRENASSQQCVTAARRAARGVSLNLSPALILSELVFSLSEAAVREPS